MKAKLLILLIFFLVLIKNAEAQNFKPSGPNKSVKFHEKLQQDTSYLKWKKQQPKKRKNNVKSALKQKKYTLKNIKRNNRLIKYENRGRKRIIRTH
jgi:hypothetical protein